jgi:hypothetical protein
MSGFCVYPVVEKPDPNNPQALIRIHKQVSFQALKELKQAYTMHGPTALFTGQLLQSVVGDSALPPEDWMGITKACLSPRKYLL